MTGHGRDGSHKFSSIEAHALSVRRIPIVLYGFSHRLDQPAFWTWIESGSAPCCSMMAKVVPEKKGKFLGLISNSYEGRVQTGKCASKSKAEEGHFGGALPLSGLFFVLGILSQIKRLLKVFQC
jgi:hypothetical protein